MKLSLSQIVKSLGLFSKPLTYEEEKELARHEDVDVRAKLAARDDIRPEILYYLAEDPDPSVRRKIASNAKTPRHADLILARDKDELVRGDLAEKIARLLPELSANEQEHLRRITEEVLIILARDQIPRVRRILSEALKDVPDAPADVIRQLARDEDIDVAVPVLRHSPVLTDEDLIAIIRAALPGRIAAISERHNLAERVADAVVESDDREAIAKLLANPSAQIREETLDRIVDQAPDIEFWHEPLVRRPKLSSRSVLKLASFVADSFLEILQARSNLDPATAKTLKAKMADRLEREEAVGEKEAETADEALARARKMKKEGNLTEETVVDALSRGDRRFVCAALAALSSEPMTLVNKVVESKSGRGMTALCWKAGLSMHCGVQLQLRFAHIAPNAAVQPVRGNQYPLTPDEMNWQIGFFRTMIPAG